MKIVALTGLSGSGKTTAIEGLIRYYVSAGSRVGALKHTHHDAGTEDRGDTQRFRAAGADPVVLAGRGRAAVFRAGADPVLMAYSAPAELTAVFGTDILLIEGFKSETGWPKIELLAGQWLTIAELVRRAESSAK